MGNTIATGRRFTEISVIMPYAELVSSALVGAIRCNGWITERCKISFCKYLEMLKFKMLSAVYQNFHSTVQMLFELLTDDPEGGPSPIPSWMFNVCYSFAAKLDCSKPQSFMNGRKVL